jgi:predicted nuclease with RNAse H fold
MPRSELWRLYPEFKRKTAFVDIETTGLSLYYDKITLIGIYDGRNYRAYIAGHNLDDFRDDVRQYGLIVTFNGSLFDLPFLRKAFPSLGLPGHVDLRFFLRRLGFSGGLKSIEKRTGVTRPEEINDFDGFDATILWNRYVHGNADALRLLVEYNRADVVNLRALMEMGCRMMRSRLLAEQGCDEGLAEGTPDLKPQAIPTVRKIGDSKIELLAERIKYVITVPKHRKKTIQPMLAKLGGIQHAPRVVGIDLTGSERRASGWALLQGTHAQTRLIKTDEELVAETIKAQPRIISIDSPLSIPGGGSGETAEARAMVRFGIMRECERTLRRRGIYVYPCLLPSMKGLTRRGMRLTEVFKKLGFEVIESYPGAAQDILGIIRKRVDVRELMQGLLDFGIDGDFNNGTISHDKLDAVTSALVGYFYLTESYEALGNEKEGYLIVPQARR